MTDSRSGKTGWPLRRLPVFLFYAAWFSLIFRDVLFGGMTFVRRDIARYYYPMWKFAADSFAEGRIPLWNPLINFGAPFAASIQNCVFYPPAWLLRAGDYGWSFNAYIVLHLCAASCWTYAWARECGQRRAAAWTAGLAYGMSGYLLSAINLTISLCTAAYLPLVLLYARRALNAPSKSAVVKVAVVMALQFLAGDPAVWLGTAMALAGALAWRAICRGRAAAAEAIRDFRTAALAAALFALLTAFQSVPFAELVLHSSRLKIEAPAAYMWSMRFHDLVGLIVPFFLDLSMYVMDYWTRQSWLENAYLGASVAALGVWVCVRQRRSELVRGHGWLLVCGLLLALGDSFPPYVWLHEHLPPLGLVRYPVRFLYLAHFAAAVLAGFAVSHLLAARERPEGRASRAEAWGLAFVFTLTAAALVSVWLHEPISRWIQEEAIARHGERIKAFYSTGHFREFIAAAWGNTRRSLVLASFASLGIAAVLRFRPRASVAAAYFIVLVAVDLGICNLSEPSASRKSFETPSSNIAYLMKDADSFRVSASPKAIYQQTFSRRVAVDAEQDDQKNRLASNYLMVYGVRDALGYDSIYLANVERIQEKLLKRKSPDENRLMDWLGIKYLASPLEKLPDSFRPVNRTKVATLYRNEGWLPRAYLVPGAAVSADREKILAEVTSPGYDPLERIWIEAEPKDAPLSVDGPLTSKAGAPVDTGNELTVSVEGGSGGWLFLSDADYPGWTARLDGRPAASYRANYAFRAAYVPPGSHRVSWKYEPPLAAAAGVVSAAAWLWALGLTGLFRRRAGKPS